MPGHVEPQSDSVVLRSWCSRVHPTKEQRKLLKAVAVAHRAVYNACAERVNHNRDAAQLSGAPELPTKLGELRALGKSMHNGPDAVQCVQCMPATVMNAAVEAAHKAAGACFAKDRRGEASKPAGKPWRLSPKTLNDNSVISLPCRRNGGPIGPVTRVTGRGTPGGSRAYAQVHLFARHSRPPSQEEIDAHVAAGMTPRMAKRQLVFVGHNVQFCDSPDVIDQMVAQLSPNNHGHPEQGCLKHGFKLVHTSTGKDYIIVVRDVVKAVALTPQQAANSRLRSADPGFKTPATTAGNDGMTEFGVGADERVAECTRQQQYLKMLLGRAEAAHRAEGQALRLLRQSDPVAKRRELPGVRPGSKSPQATRRRLQRQLAAVALKLRNWMKDLHYEWIKKMFAECDILLWPWLQTKKMLSRGGVLAPYTKNLGRALSHYLLMQRLYDKAQFTQGKALLWISEPGTSKTCGVCGAIKESWAALGSSTATQSAAAAATACRATGKVQPTTSWLECCKCTLRGATVRCCCCAPVTHALLPALTTAQSSQTACWATSGRHLRTSEVGNAVPP